MIFVFFINRDMFQDTSHNQTSKPDKLCTKRVPLVKIHLKKSRIREAKHLSTDADSSTDTTIGWTKNTQKPNFF